MKHLFDAARVEEVQARMAQLRSESAALWGTMNPAQALAHCALALEWAVGDRIPPRMWLGRIMGRMVKADGAVERRTDAPEFADGEGSGGAGCARPGHGTGAVARLDRPIRRGGARGVYNASA
jgi:hypothetical protein